MRQQRTRLVLGITIACVVIICIAGGLWWQSVADARPSITEEQASEQVLQQYVGKIVSATLNDNVYEVKLQAEKGMYDVAVDAKGRGIVSIKLIDGELPAAGETPPASSSNQPTDAPTATPAAEPTPDQSPVATPSPEQSSSPAANPSSKPSPKPSTKPSDGNEGKTPAASPVKQGISPDEAKAIALKQVKGKVEDIELKSSDRSRYFLVEIDAPDDREATVQVHAVTGAIMSITWDEDDDQEDD
ncbi:Peptidase propeptide and YPEB domain-containing protein [Paenibacillus algorifonticola]|uniref:Peptidase propeptide and YPEB domain-containing protein n=1 Tax=Paenibacillus algorifonticola TaxID=684063 RepID=A0A1I2IHD2_9BACL|nr:PepSY domain-containing protein [Paenibacillus algorifonticola]SFF40467.1 Peptidase propeptide and YPEB domain-containing protein [Paenibacillus algorifonticola]